ncbi:MAG: 3-methyl-2-oxobutanoate hydroxymethyltransferase [Bacteroidetes bacterium]|nr:3-methyl-2-oxobutanoate hydroxymethyltransferase [Bacteroidota bacterium]MBU1117231.1 3-methyl-2-oxobutanoate hydroxymethyltransferase [Bacteroidota bacterium]MBU1800295.1 3-methyl-2-oxobutanoate hydroxymethyltransferase [Bacteroidota bacterium]
MTNIEQFKKMQTNGQKISVVTCYDFWSAKIIDQSNVDAVLVGDSSAMVMHGFKTTTNATLEMMELHVAAVCRGIKNKFIIADLPFLAHRKGKKWLMNGVDRLIKAGANAVKIEGAGDNLKMISHVVNSGIPVMGHIGLTPQSVNQLGGFKVQGKEDKSSEKLLQDAKDLEKAGVFAIVLELVPEVLAEKITEAINIPTIGIGAGNKTSGQVLVLQDLLGMDNEFNPKFLRKYLAGFSLITEALNNYDSDVKSKSFPSITESY